MGIQGTSDWRVMGPLVIWRLEKEGFPIDSMVSNIYIRN
jgi:hypothetical protein